MSMHDPVADFLTRVRNAQRGHKPSVQMPYSKLKHAIAKVFLDEGYIAEISVLGEGVQRELSITLKYFEGQPVIDRIERVSRPSLRRYVNFADLKVLCKDWGVSVISTSKGVMTARAARAQGQGGELLCYVA